MRELLYERLEIAEQGALLLLLSSLKKPPFFEMAEIYRSLSNMTCMLLSPA